MNGAKTVRIHGSDVSIRAEIARISGLSAHADYLELIDWLGGLKRAPRRVFVTHGEQKASQQFAGRLEKTLGWKTTVPEWRDRITLT